MLANPLSSFVNPCAQVTDFESWNFWEWARIEHGYVGQHALFHFPSRHNDWLTGSRQRDESPHRFIRRIWDHPRGREASLSMPTSIRSQELIYDRLSAGEIIYAMTFGQTLRDW